MNPSGLFKRQGHGDREMQSSGDCPSPLIHSPRLHDSASPCLVLLVALSLFSGCATTSGLFNSFSFEREFPKASDKNPVTNIMALWQPTTGTGLDGLTCRGFAGQIFFFSHQKQLPAEVNGTVRIYVFDDQGSEEDQVKPFHQFDFSPEAWKLQFCRTKLGPTYTIFVPYTRKGPHTAQCSLRIRYTPANGAPVSSDMVNVSLPGSGGSKEIENIAKRKAARNADATDGESSSNARGHEAASRNHRDPAVQLVSATVEPQPAHRPAKLTAAERQRIIEETLARQGESADVVDDDVVYVATERTATSHRKPIPSDRAKSHRVPHVFDEDDEPETETSMIELPLQ
ncbi:MAG: hypothetical protein HZA46_18955 [Planctomycetales bacterium]|nr:hypothetical protein [Planctomycetales bacterium]